MTQNTKHPVTMTKHPTERKTYLLQRDDELRAEVYNADIYSGGIGPWNMRVSDGRHFSRLDSRKRAIALFASLAVSAAIFLAALTSVSANTPTFEQPVFPTSAYLAGCDILTFEDGSRLAECPEDVARLAYDADGQMRPNAAGVPIRAPGWYIVS